jgi:hypothetical protein
VLGGGSGLGCAAGAAGGLVVSAADFIALFGVPKAALPITLEPPGSTPRPLIIPIGFVLGVLRPPISPPGVLEGNPVPPWPAIGTVGCGRIMLMSCS